MSTSAEKTEYKQNHSGNIVIRKTDLDTIIPYLKDASNLGGGMADEVIIPETQEELRLALADCHSRSVPITISGAGTGLTGGRTPFGGAVISTERLKKIGIKPARGTERRAIVEPGVVLGEFQREAEAHGGFYPPDPTERGCSIGGTVATSASGARTFKYGATRNFVEALRIFLPDGDELSLRRGENFARNGRLELRSVSGKRFDLSLPDIQIPNIKHAAGYFIKPDMDAIDLFIGSEGTLGVIAEIELRLLPMWEKLFAGVVFFQELGALLEFVELARAESYRNRREGGGLFDARALEFFDANALECIREKYPAIPYGAAGAIWFEQECTEESETALLEEWYALLTRCTPFADSAWFAMTDKEQESLREFRHAVPARAYERISELGQSKIGTDMAVPDVHFRELFAFYREQFALADLENMTWGHIGNSHVHANIFPKNAEEFLRAKEVYRECVKKSLALGGTISAEHGVGKIKREYLQLMFGEAGICQCMEIKRALDPEFRLGRGTMFIE